MRTQKTTNVLSIYGNILLQKTWCEDCECTTFVRNHRKHCCGGLTYATPERYVRESEPEFTRHIPNKFEREKILNDQDNRCLYCDQAFGTVKHRKGKKLNLRLQWDHKLPYAYSADNRSSNFAAACHVCNAIKSDLIFQDIDEARAHIAMQRKDKGYDF